MNKYILITYITLLFSSITFAETAIEQVLKERCLATFEMMEQQDIESFVAQIPVKPSKREMKFAKKMLARKYNKWFIKSGGIKDKVFTGFEYKEPSKAKVERYGAQELIKVKLEVSTKNYGSYTSCDFIRTADGWFLSSLP